MIIEALLLLAIVPRISRLTSPRPRLMLRVVPWVVIAWFVMGWWQLADSGLALFGMLLCAAALMLLLLLPTVRAHKYGGVCFGYSCVFFAQATDYWQRLLGQPVFDRSMEVWPLPLSATYTVGVVGCLIVVLSLVRSGPPAPRR